MPEPPSSVPGAPPLSKAQVFLRRLFSFAVLWTAVLAALFSGAAWLSNLVFLAVMLALTVVGLMEFYDLAAKRGLPFFRGLGIAGAVVLLAGTFLHCTGKLGIYDSPARVNDFEVALVVLLVLGLCVRQFVSRDLNVALLRIAVTLFGLMYVAWLLNFIQKINFFPGLGDDGKYYVLYFILVTKCSDSGAYAVGSLFGRHKMIPRISPGKTWEGFGGAILGSVLASAVCAHFARGHLPGMTAPHALALGAVLGGAAVVGDLIESIFKREAGVKDSGRYFPGIGGVLDLLDSLLFNAPIMYLYLRHVLTHP